MKTPSCPACCHIQFLRPFILLSPYYISRYQPTVQSALAIPFYKWVRWGSEMFRSPWSHLTNERKKVLVAQLSERKREATDIPLGIHRRGLHYSEPSGSREGNRDTWWEVYGKKCRGEGQRPEVKEKEVWRKENTPSTAAAPGPTDGFHFTDCVLGWAMDEKMSNAHAAD